jgi:hypothetical protein
LESEKSDCKGVDEIEALTIKRDVTIPMGRETLILSKEI